MADSFSETTNVGCFSRLIESIKGVVVGFVLICVSVVVLFWGEGRAVHRAQALAEGGKAVVPVNATPVDPANEGKLIHLSAEANSPGGLSDSEFGVSAPGALRLHRKVEMYQWEQNEKTETKKNLGGSEERTTTYTYEKVWKSARIDSSKFKKPNHDNPDAMPYTDKSWNAADATIGAFKLNDVVLEVLSPAKIIVPDSAALDTINKQSKANAGTKASISSEMIYLSDPKNPNIGDVRIGYAALPSGPLSIVARQIKDTFEPYKAKSGDVLLVQTGSASADAMFKQAEEENAQMTWIIRIAGFVVILIGFSLFFAPLVTIADVVPLIGSIVGAGTFVAAFIVTIPVWFTTVAIAWVVYRPLIGIALLVVAIGVPVAFMVFRKPPQKMQPANS